MVKQSDRPEAQTPPAKQPDAQSTLSSTASPSTVSERKLTEAEVIREQMAAVVDSNRELIKVVGELVKELRIGKKAGRF